MRAHRRLARRVWRERNREKGKHVRVPWKNYLEVIASFPEFPFRARTIQPPQASPRKDWKNKFVNGVLV